MVPPLPCVRKDKSRSRYWHWGIVNFRAVGRGQLLGAVASDGGTEPADGDPADKESPASLICPLILFWGHLSKEAYDAVDVRTPRAEVEQVGKGGE